MADKWLTPNELAAKLGLSPNTVRAMLREKHPRHAGEERKRWHIPDEWAQEMEAMIPPRAIAGEREVVATVVSQKGTCAVRHKVGDEFVMGDTSSLPFFPLSVPDPYLLTSSEAPMSEVSYLEHTLHQCYLLPGALLTYEQHQS